LSAIGAGGMGEVYRARDTKLDRLVAVKVISAHLATDVGNVARFEREAKAIAALSHPNILSIFDFGVSDGLLFSVTELLEGETLRETLGGHTPHALPARKAAEYTLQITRGLAAAHEKGIVHRDLKPENLFLTTDGRVKILDFGLAAIVSSGTGANDRSDAPGSLTQLTVPATTSPGMVLGTVAYMAPEQARGLAVDHRADIFAVGAVLYEMLAGRKAFGGESAADTMSAILNAEPPALPGPQRTDTTSLDRIARRCLEKRPAERFQSAADIAFAIEATTIGSGASVAVANIPSPADAASSVASSSAAASSPSALVVASSKPGFSRALAASLVAIAIALGGTWFGRHSIALDPPIYTPLTFQLGLVTSARFAPDGQVVYSARWEAPTVDIYAVRTAQPSPRTPIASSAHLLNVSSSGVMRVLISARATNDEGQYVGTLAELPLEGGTPREIAADVRESDCTRDGSHCGIVRFTQGRSLLEYPPGKVIYETVGYVSDVRIAPSGSQIAFMDHPENGDNRGTVAVIDSGGSRQVITPEWSAEGGLAWNARGDEVWFTATSDVAGPLLYGVTPGGRLRVIGAIPGRLRLFDVDANGRALIARQDGRVHTMAGRFSETREAPRGERPRAVLGERDVSWLDWTIPQDLSSDGSLMLFSLQGMTGGRLYSAMFRRLDGSIPVRIGDGNPASLSRDGKWALVHVSSRPEKLLMEPLGPGESRDLTTSGFRYAVADWLPSGNAFVFSGAEANHPPRVYYQEIGKVPQAITDEGVIAPPHAVSPDGTSIFVFHRDRTWHLQSLDGKRGARDLPGLTAIQRPVRWSRDMKELFVVDQTPPNATLYRYDIASGHSTLEKRFQAKGGFSMGGVGQVVVSPDGSSYVYASGLSQSQLFLVTGLR
jgi:serine/threonine protein kinase